MFDGNYGGAPSAGLSAPVSPQTTLQSPLYGSSPLQTPFQYAAAPASPDPRNPGATTLTAFGATPGRSTPIPPFGNSLPANNGLDINAFASSLTSPALPGNTAGTAIERGLLDFSYAEQSPKQTAGYGSTYSHSQGGSPFSPYPPGIAGGTGLDMDDLRGDSEQRAEDRKAIVGKLKSEAIRYAKEEVIQVFIDFWSYYNSATDEEKAAIHAELGAFGISVIPVVSEVKVIIENLEDGEISLIEGVEIAVAIAFLVFTVAKTAIKSVKTAVAVWRWFKKVAKRGRKRAAKKAIRAWASEEVKVIVRDAFAGFAEEFILQAFAVGGKWGKWDVADLGISTISGAASGAINQNSPPSQAAWHDLANAILTAFLKNNLPLGTNPNGPFDTIRATFQLSTRAVAKAAIMAGFVWGLRAALTKLGVKKQYLDDILILFNVLFGKAVDMVLDSWMTEGE